MHVKEHQIGRNTKRKTQIRMMRSVKPRGMNRNAKTPTNCSCDIIIKSKINPQRTQSLTENKHK